MKKVNVNEVEELAWTSPKGKFAGFGRQISEALGREPDSTDLLRRHPFDVELLRIPPGHAPYFYHSHSAQWEFYHVVAGSGTARHAEGVTPIVAGDAFLFKPGEPHQLFNDGSEDMLVFVVADNPFGESHYHPDSNKWSVPIPKRRFLRGADLDYFEGEE